MPARPKRCRAIYVHHQARLQATDAKGDSHGEPRGDISDDVNPEPNEASNEAAATTTPGGPSLGGYSFSPAAPPASCGWPRHAAGSRPIFLRVLLLDAGGGGCAEASDAVAALGAKENVGTGLAETGRAEPVSESHESLEGAGRAGANKVRSGESVLTKLPMLTRRGRSRQRGEKKDIMKMLRAPSSSLRFFLWGLGRSEDRTKAT